ncbi:MAG TPA: hypothetical protein VGO59_14935 [Verrucomicrobiae bacterium]
MPDQFGGWNGVKSGAATAAIVDSMAAAITAPSKLRPKMFFTMAIIMVIGLCLPVEAPAE